jgi:L-threonylcarbamoyladenylate synthase
MNTKIIKTDDLSEAIELLKSGETVAIPTETVYGLAANALNPTAIEKIFTAKGRPRDNPLIVHVSDIEMAKTLGLEIPELAKGLAERFWAGSLTMIFKKNENIIPDEVSCGLDTVAVRVPNHKVALEIIKLCGFPLAAPSANTSGSPSPTEAGHVYEDLNNKIPLIIDGGKCSCGVESTVIMLDNNRIRILRPGAVTPEQLSEFAEVIIDDVVTANCQLLIVNCQLPSPGTAHKHYAPKAQVIAVSANNEKAFLSYIDENKYVIENPETHTLFAKLREFDNLGAGQIFIRLPEPTGIGLALYNRIIRAANFNIVNLSVDFNKLNIIGLTGMSGAGKSLAASVFEKHNYRVVDCDNIAKNTISGKKCTEKIKHNFPELYDERGKFNRVKAARIIFSDLDKLKRYENTVYPFIVYAVIKFIEKYARKGECNFLLDAPTLYQSGADDFCKKIIAVVADKTACIKRITERDGINENDAALRLNSQPNAEFYKNKGNVVIENNNCRNSFIKNIEKQVKNEN